MNPPIFYFGKEFPSFKRSDGRHRPSPSGRFLQEFQRFRRAMSRLKFAFGFFLLFAQPALAADESSTKMPAQEVQGTAQIIHRNDVIHDAGTNIAGPMRLWPLYSTTQSRMNYVEVTGRSGMHFHPDADHKLYVLEGELLVTGGTNTMTAKAGDLIIIPKGVRHCYDVPAKDGRALLLTFDAPPYDPKKTVSVERQEHNPREK